MKKTFILSITILSFLITKAQINENFDSYAVGQKFVEQAGAPWTTWSNAPGGSEDPVVTNVYSYSDFNSIFIANNNDLVLLVNDLTTGRYKFDFFAYIENGKIGYFNALQDFAGNNSKWGMQVYFKSQGNGSLDANGEDIAQFSFNYDTWILVQIYFDLNENLATLVIDTNEVYTWPWDKGAFGQNNLLKLDAFNFFGWTGDNGNETSGLYIDNVQFTQLSTPVESPQNLTATLNNGNIELNWTPTYSTPTYYSVFRNGLLIANNVTDTFFVDPNPYPGDYTYQVRAFYFNEGYSNATNEATVTVPGGVDRDYVLIEEFTEVNCYYCPGAAIGIDEMVANGDRIAPIAYHTQWQGNDEFYTSATDVRVAYYNITGTPTVQTDGSYDQKVGGNHTASLYDVYHPVYEARIAHKAVHKLYATVTQNDEANYSITVKVNQYSDYFSGSKSLFVAITETDINRSWQGLSKVNFTLRKMVTSNTGQTVSFSNAVDSAEFVFDFTVDTVNWNLNNCDIVVFLQDDGTKEVMQTITLELPVINSLSTYSNQPEIRIYPNPINDAFVIKNAKGYDYKIINIIGKIEKSGKIKSNLKTIETSNLPKGIYFVKLNKGNSKYIKKLIKS